MVEERDLTLLDDYLAHRMDSGERAAFEQKLEGNPDLQSEYELQKYVVERIRQARVSELKSMLNKVPVPSHGGKAATTSIAAAATAALIAAAALWYFNRPDNSTASQSADTAVLERFDPPEQTADPRITAPEVRTPETTRPAEAAEVSPVPAPVEKEQAAAPDKNQTSAGTEHSRPSLAQKPVPPAGPTRAAAAAGDVDVAIVGDASHNFHYQYQEGKLRLFGTFDPAHVTVTRISWNGAVVPVLSFNDRYYLLTGQEGEIHPLEPVTDAEQRDKVRNLLSPQ